MNVDALELALALHQAPIQRFALRDRPLPGNIGEVLQLASAMQPQLGNTAARCSQSEEMVLEAVRFYLHQVLFEPGTDAYRILGLAPDADSSLIRQHHIWLQRWLHPDRRGEDWEAVLTTKVNWAWQQLRNETSRAEYDRTRLESAQLPAINGTGEDAIQTPAWSVAPVGNGRPHWLRRVAIGGLLLAILCLIYLGATRQDRVDPDALASQSLDAQSTSRPRLPFDGNSMPHERLPTARVPEATSAPAPADIEFPKPVKDAISDHLDDRSPAARESGQDRIARDHSAPVTNDPTVTPAPFGRKPSASIPDAGWLAGSTAVAGPVRVRPSGSGLDGQHAVASERIVPSMKAQDPAPTQPVSRQPARRGNAVASAPTVTPFESGQAVDSGIKDREPSAEMALTDHPRDVVETQPDSRSTADAHAPEPVSMLKRAESGEAGSDALTARSSQPPVDPDLSEPTLRQTPEDLGRETLARLELARERVRGMVRYLRSQDTGLPKWNDEHGERSVERERSALHARNEHADAEAFALGSPTWRITNSAVAMQATYHVDSRRSDAESGQLMLDMVWRAGNWKITRIEVSPSR